MATPRPFKPTDHPFDFHRNAVQMGPPFEDDSTIGFGFISAAEALIEHWVEHGPNDGHFLPIVWNYRHGIELLLKGAISDAARGLRMNGDPDPGIVKSVLDRWLAKDARHSLEALLNRLDLYLQRIGLEKIDADTRSVVIVLHNIDPAGDSFRYAMTWDKAAKSFIPAKRPTETHIDVVAMGEEFSAAASLIGGGVLTQLQEYRDYLSELGP